MDSTMTHSFITKKGDSGTPIIVQPEEGIPECCLVGIHFGKQGKESVAYENKAVKITNKVVKILKQY